MDLTLNPTQKTHIVWLDVVRLVAMFTVVSCHSADPFNFYPGEPPANIAEIKWWGAVYGSLLRPCVPLFVMITGALLLPVKGEVAPFYRKRIGRVFWPFLIWSVIYNLFPWITGLLGVAPEVILDFFPYSGEEVMRQSLDVSLGYIAQMPFNFSLLDVHMWYIYLLIGLYLYMPVFSAWVEKASRKAQRWFLVAWGVTLFVPYYREFVGSYIWGSCSWNEFYMLYMFAGFNGYLLLGHYVKENKDGNILKIFWPFSGNGESDRHNSNWSVWKTFLICAVMFAVGYYVTYTGFSTTAANPNATETEMELYFTFCSPNVLLMTLAAFLLMKKVVVNTPVVVKALANMTKCGFGIYMVHYFVVGPFFLLIGPSEIPIPLQVPLMAVCIFLCSWAFTAAVYKVIPKKAKYFMG